MHQLVYIAVSIKYSIDLLDLVYCLYMVTSEAYQEMYWARLK